MALELAQDDKVQWQRFDGKLRNQIQKAEKAAFGGLTVMRNC